MGCTAVISSCPSLHAWIMIGNLNGTYWSGRITSTLPEVGQLVSEPSGNWVQCIANCANPPGSTVTSVGPGWVMKTRPLRTTPAHHLRVPAADALSWTITG